jgi:single-strand DNA-binding protein
LHPNTKNNTNKKAENARKKNYGKKESGMYQKVTLVGRLTKAPELKFTPNGIGVCNFTLAVDGDYNKTTKKMDAEFINIVAWNRGENKQAERIAEYLDKGCIALVEGKIKTRNYEKDGVKRYITEVIADNVKFITMKPKQDNFKLEGEIDFADFGTVVEEPAPLPF